MTELNEEDADHTKLRVYAIYCQLIESIKHFDRVQNSYRLITSTLLLAAFAVFGFLYSINPDRLPFHVSFAQIALSGLAICGVTVMGFLDLIFQERMLVAHMVELIKLERKYKWLPQIHHNMIHHGSQHGTPIKKAVYYIGCVACLIIVLSVSVYFEFSSAHSLLAAIIIPPSAVIALILYSWCFYRAVGNYATLVERFLLQTRHSLKEHGRLL